MEPIQINVSVELNLSQDVKKFFTSVFNHAPVVSAAPTAPTAPATPATLTAPAAPAAPAPLPDVPAVSAVPQVTIEQVRQALAAKVNGHREEIKEKLLSLGAPSVTKLDPSKYREMLTFLNAL